MTDADVDALRDELREPRDEIRAYLDGEGVDASGWDDRSETERGAAESG